MFSWGTREALLQVVPTQLGISPDVLGIENQLEWGEDLSPTISKVQLDPIHMKSNQTLSCYSLETLNCMIHQESPARHIRSTIGASLLISLSPPHLCHKEWVPVLSLRQTSVTIYSFISQVTEKMFRKILTKKVWRNISENVKLLSKQAAWHCALSSPGDGENVHCPLLRSASHSGNRTPSHHQSLDLTLREVCFCICEFCIFVFVYLSIWRGERARGLFWRASM